MKERPILETKRLLLRPFRLEDAAEVQRLAGDREVASTTLNIPYPYEDGMAEKWISEHLKKFEKGELVNFAITLRPEKILIGAIGLHIVQVHARAELGYWIGRPWWNRGYCTEAAREVVRFGFESLHLNRIQAHHFSRNPSSGRVMQKIGMFHEGRHRQYVNKWDVFEDLEMYAMVKDDYGKQPPV